MVWGLTTEKSPSKAPPRATCATRATRATRTTPAQPPHNPRATHNPRTTPAQPPHHPRTTPAQPPRNPRATPAQPPRNPRATPAQPLHNPRTTLHNPRTTPPSAPKGRSHRDLLSKLGRAQPPRWDLTGCPPLADHELDLAKVLACHESAAPAMQFNPWENLTLRKCCACHEICTRPCQNAAPATQFNPCKTSALPCQWARRARSETAPRPLRPDAADRPAFASPETPLHAQGHSFCDFLISGDADSCTGPRFLRLSLPLPHARAFFLAGLLLLLSFVSECQLSISCRNTEVPSKLPLIKFPFPLTWHAMAAWEKGLNPCIKQKKTTLWIWRQPGRVLRTT